MRFKKFKVLSLLIAMMVMLSANFAYAVGFTDNVEETKVKETIEQYFTAYYDTLKLGTLVDVSKLFFDNDDTVIPQRLLENRFKLYNAFNLKVDYYTLDLEFQDVNIETDKASVSVIENVDLKYNNTPKDVISKIRNIEYTIKLKKDDSQWKISSMNSNSDDYEKAKTKIEKLEQRSKSLSVEDSESSGKDKLNKVFDELDSNISVLKNYQSKFTEPDIEETDDTITIMASSYYYNSNDGVEYARTYGKSAAVDEDEKLFYYSSGSDCTNFVSQCVWAAYGGWVEGDISTSKSNVSNKVRMVSNVWQAGTGGGVTNWESVTSFYSYVTSSKTYGPKGTSYGGCTMDDFNFYNVSIGHVLQFYPEGESWHHSVYVTELGTPGEYSTIYVTQHSSDKVDRPLAELLEWIGDEGELRGIQFSTAKFST